MRRIRQHGKSLRIALGVCALASVGLALMPLQSHAQLQQPQQQLQQPQHRRLQLVRRQRLPRGLLRHHGLVRRHGHGLSEKS